MARFANIVLAYFIVGAVLWGGGVIHWNQSGVGGLFIEHAGDDTQVNEETAQGLENSGNAIIEAAGNYGGGIIAVWNTVLKVLGYLFWPITVLQSVNAPPRAVVLLGGGMTVAMFGAFIRLVRQSA